jgi:hypothetical protein
MCVGKKMQVEWELLLLASLEFHIPSLRPEKYEVLQSV